MKIFISYDANVDQIALDAFKGRLMFSEIVKEIELELYELCEADKLVALISEDADKKKIYNAIESAKDRNIPILAVKLHKKQDITLPDSLGVEFVDWSWERMELFLKAE